MTTIVATASRKAGTGPKRHSQPQLPLRPAGPDTVRALLEWYDVERRDLPWRYGRRQKADPYRVWLSEIMLQQTTVKTVIPYFQKFTQRWPTVKALARASLDDVLQMWAGLGYYSRARNLKACADAVVENHGGQFPNSEKELLALPGVGPYTAAAIAAIAFGARATPVDGNIERVVARLFGVRQPLPAAKPEIKRLAETLVPARRAGDFAQAMMDLGARICTAKSPSCLMCPVQRDCAAQARGMEGEIPLRAPKKPRPARHGLAFLALREDGAVLLRKRPATGLLGGMMEIPSTTWSATPVTRASERDAVPVTARWHKVPEPVIHIFTHFRLELMVHRAFVPLDTELTLWADADQCQWVHRSQLDDQALPTVFRKAIAHAMADF